MTDPRGHRSDPAPAPPISTRWSEAPEPDDDTDAPPPPYVPASRGPGGESTDAVESGAAAEPFPFEAPAEEAPGLAGGEIDEDEPVDDFPFDAFEIEGPEESGAGAAEGAWETGSGPAPLPATHALPDYTGEPLPGRAGTSDAYGESAPDAVTEVAFELERIARLLREQGPDAVAAEMASPDRLTAILAGVVAGYVTGRD